MALLAPNESVAQRGVVQGRVVDINGTPLAYANVMLQWTTCGAMTNKYGTYVILAPVGPHEVKAHMMGHFSESKHISLDEGDTVVVNFILQRDDDFDRKQVIIIPESRDNLNPVQDDPWPYDASLEPVRWESLEFEFRYILTQQADSVLVNLVAEARNVTAEPFTVCGRFSFWKATYRISSEVFYEVGKLGGRGSYDGPVLAVSADGSYSDRRLICHETTIPPGGSIARGMSFSFSAKTFEYWTGEVLVQCFFFAGRNGMQWSEGGWRIYLGEITVPIRPIGQPLRHP